MRRDQGANPAAERPVDIRERLGVRPVINLTGTLTAFGGISARPEACEAAAAMLARGVDMVELQARASAVVARVTGAEAGFVAACSSAGLCMAIAGAMTGDDLTRIEALPDTTGMRDEVLMQVGHQVNYGHPIAQDVRQTGATLITIGDVNAARPHHLAGAISARTVAGLYVVSHHCARGGQIGFEDFVRVCHERGVPVIVDLAAEYDLTGYHRAGADITVHSAHKFLGGATAGIVSGRKDLVRAAFMQSFGIGRPMKVGKEGVAGALAALDAWGSTDHDVERRRARAVLERWREQLAGFPGIEAAIDPDPTGNPFDRLKVHVGPEAPVTAVELVWRLETGAPPIAVRTHDLDAGSFVLDPRSLGPGEAQVVGDRLHAVLAQGPDTRGAAPLDIHRWRAARAEALGRWPDLTTGVES